jgi:hypothetical protein
MVGLIAVSWITGWVGNQAWSNPSPFGGYKWSTVYIVSMLLFVAVTTVIK